MTSSIADHGETLAPLMRAGRLPLRLPRHREHPRRGPGVPASASAKNAQRENGRRTGNATLTGDRASAPRTACSSSAASSSATPATRASRSRPTWRSRASYVDWPYIQHPTPYPGHADDEGLPRPRADRQRRLEEYDGTTAVVRTEHLSAEEIEFLRWRAERWMKLRHSADALRHSPWFVLRHGPEMLRAHVPRQHVAIALRARERARTCLPAIRQSGGRNGRATVSEASASSAPSCRANFHPRVRTLLIRSALAARFRGPVFALCSANAA